MTASMQTANSHAKIVSCCRDKIPAFWIFSILEMEVLFIDVFFYTFGMLSNTPLSVTYTFMLQNEKQLFGGFFAIAFTV